MTGTATAAGVTRARDFRNSLQSTAHDFSFYGALRNKETGTNERFVSAPLLACRIAELANRTKQRIARESRTVFSARFTVPSARFTVPSARFSFGEPAPQSVTILPDDGGLGSRDIQNPLAQHRRRRNEHTTTRRLKPRLRHALFLVNMNRKPHVRATN